MHFRIMMPLSVCKMLIFVYLLNYAIVWNVSVEKRNAAMGNIHKFILNIPHTGNWPRSPNCTITLYLTYEKNWKAKIYPVSLILDFNKYNKMFSSEISQNIKIRMWHVSSEHILEMSIAFLPSHYYKVNEQNLFYKQIYLINLVLNQFVD